MLSDTIYPKYEQIDLRGIGLVDGYYSLGFLQTFRPDCVWITPNQWQDFLNFEWLDLEIKNALKQNKNVCVVVNDEAIMFPQIRSFTNCLNNYANDPVWLITQLDDLNQKIYTFQYGLRCKILEIPWVFLNDCWAYDRLSKRNKGSSSNQHNFLCMLGDPKPHKLDLVKALRQQNLDKFGLITVKDPQQYPDELMEYCQVNPRPPYTNSSKKFLATASHHQINDIWISGNVANWLYLEEYYADIPLIIHPETHPGIFFNTEKSLWPLLLGKLMLIHGKVQTMASMQKFYDVDFTTYADLSFDQINNDWTNQGHQGRLKLLLDLNRPLIQDCKEIYLDLQPQLESARWNIGRSIYVFTVQQLQKIM